MVFRNNEEKIKYAQILLEEALPFQKPFNYYRVISGLISRCESFVPFKQSWKIRLENALQKRLKEDILRDFENKFTWDELLFILHDYQLKMSKI